MRYGTGFHEAEGHEGRPFRWMERQSRLELEPAGEARFLEFEAGGVAEDLEQSLTVGNGADAQSFALVEGWNVISVAVPAGTGRLELGSDRALPAERRPGDARELALRLREPHLHHDPERHARARQRHEARLRNARAVADSLLGAYRRTGRALRVLDGFHAAEVDEGQSFRWMARRGRVGLPSSPGVRFLEMQVRSHTRDLSQHLALRTEGAEPLRLPLVEGWNTVSLQVPPGIDCMTLEADRTVPPSLHAGDGRELALQVRWPLLHEDAQRHAHVSAQHANRALNYREMLEGATELASTPWRLGIDMVGTCNVKPPCVYCNWDEVKEQEGQAVDLPFNLQTLREYGPLFERASELVNCSIGEPFMMREIDLLLDVFGSRGKLLELTTNGQILTDTNIRKLLGRNAHLYISLDAATPETYARLRNRTFPRLLENVRRLVQAKGGRGQLPLVYLVFMPMRANLQEVDAFVELCAELQADRLVLRPLNASDALDLVWEREGYHFDYQRELLPFDELVRVSGRVAELCRRLGVELSDQMDMGGSMADEFAALFEEGRRQAAQAPLRIPGAPPAPLPAWGTGEAPAHVAPPEAPAVDAPPTAAEANVQVPICTEPWTSLYVLRRGTLPCCYGGSALAPMTGFKDVWNSPVVQDIRRDLAAGRFHRYCLESQDCPIVRKAAAGHALPVRQSALLAARRGLARLRRFGAGVLEPLRRRAGGP